MNNKKLEQTLQTEYLTVEDIVKMGISKRTVNRWIIDGVRFPIKGENHKFSNPIKLETPVIKSKVIVNVKDLERFFKKIKRKDLISLIPSFMRSN